MDAQQAGPSDTSRERWQRRFDQAAKARTRTFTTLSGLEVDPVLRAAGRRGGAGL